MIFFKLVFFTLFVIAFFNGVQMAVEYELRPIVYRCEEVSTADPINVQKKCRKWIAEKKTTAEGS
jgi:hypothetical protein